jgi:rubredoxin
MGKWKCMACDYVYDPASGDPDNGAVPGTKFEDISETWACPECGATKDLFEQI